MKTTIKDVFDWCYPDMANHPHMNSDEARLDWAAMGGCSIYTCDTCGNAYTTSDGGTSDGNGEGCHCQKCENEAGGYAALVLRETGIALD